MIMRTGFVSVEELAHSRRLAKAQKVMATLTHRAHRKLEREGAMENLSSGASEAGPIEALSLRDQELMKMEARQVVDEWLRPEFRGSAAAASHEAAWGPVGAFCPSRLFRSRSFFVVSATRPPGDSLCVVEKLTAAVRVQRTARRIQSGCGNPRSSWTQRSTR